MSHHQVNHKPARSKSAAAKSQHFQLDDDDTADDDKQYSKQYYNNLFQKSASPFINKFNGDHASAKPIHAAVVDDDDDSENKRVGYGTPASAMPRSSHRYRHPQPPSSLSHLGVVTASAPRSGALGSKGLVAEVTPGFGRDVGLPRAGAGTAGGMPSPSTGGELGVDSSLSSEGSEGSDDDPVPAEAPGDCNDGVRNGRETGVDCGGISGSWEAHIEKKALCKPCAEGVGCIGDDDCVSHQCGENFKCLRSPPTPPPSPSAFQEFVASQKRKMEGAY
jgi:hypothetical protein